MNYSWLGSIKTINKACQKSMHSSVKIQCTVPFFGHMVAALVTHVENSPWALTGFMVGTQKHPFMKNFIWAASVCLYRNNVISKCRPSFSSCCYDQYWYDINTCVFIRTSSVSSANSLPVCSLDLFFRWVTSAKLTFSEKSNVLCELNWLYPDFRQHSWLTIKKYLGHIWCRTW